MKNYSLRNWLLIVPIFVALAARVPFDFQPFHCVDEGVLGTMGNIILRGGLPYRDGWCHRGPLLHYIYAGIFALFGRNNMLAVHLLTTCIIGIQSWLLYRLARLYFDKTVGLVAALLFVFFSTFGYSPEDSLAANVEIWMNIFILLSINVFVRTLRSDSRWGYLGSGVLLGLAALTKQVAFALLPLLVITLLLAHNWEMCGRRKMPVEIIKFSFMIVVGTLLPLAGTIAWYVHNRALEDFTHLFFGYNLHYISSFYAPSTGVSLRTLIKRFLESGLSNLSIFASGRTLLPHGLFVAGLLNDVVSRIWRINGLPLPTRFFYFWFLASAIPLLALGRAFPHYYLQLLPIVSVVAAAMAERIYSKCSSPISRFALMMFCACLLVYPAITFIFEYKSEPYSVARRQRLDAVTAYVKAHSSPSDSIFVWGWDMELYCLTDRQNASRFIFFSFLTDRTYGDAEPAKYAGDLSHLPTVKICIDDLTKAQPRLILDGYVAEEFTWQFPLKRYQTLWEYINNNYHAVKKINGYVVYERNSP